MSGYLIRHLDMEEPEDIGLVQIQNDPEYDHPLLVVNEDKFHEVGDVGLFLEGMKYLAQARGARLAIIEASGAIKNGMDKTVDYQIKYPQYFDRTLSFLQL